MKTVSKIALAVVFPVLMLMTACGGTNDVPEVTVNGSDVYEHAGVDNGEARKIIVDVTPCIVWDGGQEGGISCGWNATDPTATDVR